MLVILSPELDLTNSLLMKRPVGNVIFFPLGAVSSTFKSAILENLVCEVVNGRSAVILYGAGLTQHIEENGCEERNNGLFKSFNI